MGCNQTETNDFEKINKGYDSLIKSVEMEMEGYYKKLKKMKKDPKKVDNIKDKYDQKIFSILHDPKSYNDYSKYFKNSGDLSYLIENRKINNDICCLEDKAVISRLKTEVIIKLNELKNEREKEISKNSLKIDEIEEYNELDNKIQLCKNQIRTYEKEKQAAIIAKREEIRNNLLNNNMNNGILPLYQERHGFNQVVDNRIVNQIHQDYGNKNN